MVESQGRARGAHPALRLVWPSEPPAASFAPSADTGLPSCAPVCQGALALHRAPDPLRLVTVGVAGAADRLGARVIAETGLAGLSRDLLHETTPDAVACPLIAPDFDAFDVVQRLQGLGFSGMALVLTPPLPMPGLVERELAAAAPDLAIVLRSRKT